MSAPWEATQPVDEARAAALVSAQFPSLRGAPVRAVASGWDNSVLLVDDVLFRFPRREIALAGMQRELAEAGDVPREAAAEAAGGFLRSLHDLRVDVELPVDPMGRGTPGLRRELTRKWLGALASRGLWSGSAEVDALLDSPLVPVGGAEVLAHGDLHLRHLLVDGSGRATGVIDWGDVCLAVPSFDLSLLYAAFDGPARELGLAAYGPVSGEREVRARALAVGLAAALADWAASTGATDLLPEYLRGIDRAAR